MSPQNGHRPRRDSSSPAGSNATSQQPSTANAESPAGNGFEDQRSLVLETLDFTQLTQTGSAFLTDCSGGQQWLRGFTLRKDDTDVSLRLRTTDRGDASSAPHSLLPLFAQWLPQWYKIAQEHRKVDKATRVTTAITTTHEFDWLLVYLADYIDLGHDFLDPVELRELCAAVLDICQRTTRASDIDASISILHRVILLDGFPKELLGEALEVFCAATIILSESPAILSVCVELFLLGPFQSETLDCLFKFVVTPTIQNNSHKLMQGRGAIRQLSEHIDIKDSSHDFIIRTARFMDAFLQASKSCIYRYCTEVLRASHLIFDSVQLEDILSTEFEHIMDAVDNCVRTVLPRSNSSRAPLPPHSPDREEINEHEKHAARYLEDRYDATKRLLLDLEDHWELLSAQQRARVSNLFMDHARDLTDLQALLVIRHLPALKLQRGDISDWSARVSKVFDAFVRSPKISGNIRLEAISYCASSATAFVIHGDRLFAETKGLTSTAGTNIVDRLLSALVNEHDTTVVAGILKIFVDLAFVSSDKLRFPYIESILRKLLWLVKNERESGEDQDDKHIVMCTCAIRDIFIKGLFLAAPVSARAFEALIEIAETAKSRTCQLSALRLLTRIRCDHRGFLYLQTEPDSQYIAVALCRTDEARDAFSTDTAVPRMSSSSLNATYFGAPKQLWSYPPETEHTAEWPVGASQLVGVRGQIQDIDSSQIELRMSDWLVTVIKLFQGDTDWEILSFMLVHMGAQLFNTRLFDTSLESIVKLRQVLCDQVVNGTFREPPGSTGLKKSDSALCMFNLLTALIPYATHKSEHIQKGFGDDLVKAFLSGIGGSWDGTSRGCIHALCVCSFEIPASVASQYPNIITKMSKNMTQSHLTIHILEFLAQVARLPEVHSNFTQDEITMIFGICLQFLEKTREYHASSLSAPSPRSVTPARHSGLSLRRPPYRAALLHDVGLPQYASALAYHTLIFWFLSLKLEFRAKYVSWIVPRLVWKNASGEDTIDEQSQVFIDFMQRTAFSDLGETKPITDVQCNSAGQSSSSSWIVGLSIITAETDGQTGMTKVTKRQAAGTTHSLYTLHTAPLPSHHVPSHTEIQPADGDQGSTSMLPPHVLLQMMTTAAPTSVDEQPLALPKEEFVTRALNVFDRIATVDSHKLGVLYIGRDQTQDVEYLGNRASSLHYQQFLDGLGYVVSLERPLAFNPQGLQHPRDGTQTVAWRDRVTEIVYHVPTMMPNHTKDDPTFVTKKSHVGNCHVVIVFNESGLPWNMENFRSAVTFVHIVITPANRADATYLTQSALPEGRASMPEDMCDFYSVHVLTKEGHPNVTPAADPKVISRAMLPGFVRMLGLSANVFSQAKVADDSNDHEFPSSWRTRLQEIKRLKQRVMEKTLGQPHQPAISTGTVVTTSAGGGRRTPVTKDDNLNGVRDSERDGALAMQLDFGKWTL